MSPTEGWHGWDEYAAFYDWENARTMGRRDIAFWRRMVTGIRGPVLELGCGTGRLLGPLARSGVSVFGVDRSAPMLRRARERLRRLPPRFRPAVVRADIRSVPFQPNTFDVVIAAYGLLQSLLTNDDLNRAVAEAARVLRPRGRLGLDLVPDLPAWNEYQRRVRLRGRTGAGGRVTLIETVRQDPRRGITMFDEEFIERRGRHEERRVFSLTFRTISLVDLVDRLDRAGLEAEALLGDYRGTPLDLTSETWLVLARKR